MRLFHGFRTGALALTISTSAFTAVVATASPASAGVTVTGTGSSYSAVAINNWVGQVSNLYGLSVNYQTSSSVYGLDNFAEQQVNFGASEIGYSSGQASATPKFAYQYLPDVAGATCMMFQVPSATQQPIQDLKLDSDTMMGIFSGLITNWNDAKIKALNPDQMLPNHPITAVYRTDPSGDNYLFSDYLRAMQPSAWAAYTSTLSFPPGSNSSWPVPQGSTSAGNYNFSGFVGQNGSDNASNYVAANPYAITYVETAYAILHGQPCAAVRNASGNFVAPSSESDALALTHDKLQANFEQDLSDVYTAPEGAAYPISAYSYIVTQTTGLDPAVGKVLGKFIAFMACQGQISAGQLGYSPIPPNLVAVAFDAIKRLPGADAPPALTGDACPNPYLTGAATYVGGPSVAGSGGEAANAAALAAGVSAKSADSVSKGLLAKKHGGVSAAPGQTAGSALNAAVSGMSGTKPSTPVVLGLTAAFLLLVAVPPTVGVMRRRRVAQSLDEGGDES
jgi:phosphate ABC transporter phosphate-binding protein